MNDLTLIQPTTPQPTTPDDFYKIENRIDSHTISKLERMAVEQQPLRYYTQYQRGGINE